MLCNCGKMIWLVFFAANWDANVQCMCMWMWTHFKLNQLHKTRHRIDFGYKKITFAWIDVFNLRFIKISVTKITWSRLNHAEKCHFRCSNGKIYINQRNWANNWCRRTPFSTLSNCWQVSFSIKLISISIPSFFLKPMSFFEPLTMQQHIILIDYVRWASPQSKNWPNID